MQMPTNPSPNYDNTSIIYLIFIRVTGKVENATFARIALEVMPRAKRTDAVENITHFIIITVTSTLHREKYSIRVTPSMERQWRGRHVVMSVV